MATRTMSRRPNRRSAEPEDQYEESTTREEDEEPPRRGRARSSRRDSDEDERPARSSRSSRRDEEEDERPARRSRRDSDEDERPSRSAGRGTTGRGWSAYKKQREERSDFVKTYKMAEKPALIKILEDEPFSVYAEHWLDELKGKKSWTCLGEDCPLCDIGDRPRVYALFNILDLDDPDNPVVKPWKVSQTVADVLEDYALDPKTGPLSRDDIYWAVHKSGGGKKGRVQTHITPVKARDLEEDWDLVPFTADELDEFDLIEEEAVVFINSRKELQEIADDL